MHDPGYRLRWAIINNQLSIVKRLLERFPDLLTNIDSSNGYSNLHYAASNGHHPICVYLVSKGHDKQEISLNFVRQTPLHLATASNHEQTVHFLCREFPRTIDGFKSITDNFTPVILAAKLGHDPVLNILLDFDADINAADSKGNRAVHYAAAGGFIRVLRTLADRFADFETSNYEGWKPFQYAANYNIEDWIKNYSAQKKLQQSSPFAPRAASGITNYNNISTSTVNTVSSAATINAFNQRVFQSSQANINKSLPYTPEVSEKVSPSKSAARIGLGIGLASPSANISASTSMSGSTSTLIPTLFTASISTLESANEKQPPPLRTTRSGSDIATLSPGAHRKSSSESKSPNLRMVDKDKDLPVPPIDKMTSPYNGTIPQSPIYFIEDSSHSSSSISTTGSTTISLNTLNSNNNMYQGFNNSNQSLGNPLPPPAGMIEKESTMMTPGVTSTPASLSVISLSSSLSPRKGTRTLPTVSANNVQTSPLPAILTPNFLGIANNNNNNSNNNNNDNKSNNDAHVVSFHSVSNLGQKSSPKSSTSTPKPLYSPAKPAPAPLYPGNPAPWGSLTPSRINQVNFPSVNSSSSVNDVGEWNPSPHKSKFLGIPIERISKPRRVSSDL